MSSESNLELNTIMALAGGRDLVPFPAGAVIYNAGDRGDCLYAVIEGAVSLAWDDGRLRETIPAGHCFGVGALVDPDHLRYCTATAVSDARLLPMNREQFLLAVQELPMFAIEMLHDLDARLRSLKGRCIGMAVDQHHGPDQQPG
jgi:CRP/FNR family cyclic AMP-dependent transcriptional regulator